MSGLKKGTITVECGPGMKNSFFRRLPFSEGLQIEIGEEDDTIQIQYELDNQGIETLVNFLNKQDKQEFWMTSHSQDDQHKDYDQDLARDISKILAYDDDGDDIIHPSQGKGDLPGQNLGSIGKPLDDGKKNAGPSNAKGLKSKSSSFYPPTDPRSMQDDQYGRGGGPIGTNPMPKQPANHMLVPTTNSVQYRVDDFDQLFQSDDEAAPNYYPRGPMGMGGQGMMNPNMSRVANPNMNPNLNPNMRVQGNLPMGHHGMGAGQMGQGGNQMYPAQNMPAVPARKAPGPMPGGVGMNPNFPQQKPTAGQRMAPGGMQGMQGQDMGFYGNFEDPQAKPQKGLRSANKGVAGAQRGYSEYSGYAEDDMQGYSNMDYGRGNAGPMGGGYPQHNRMGNNPQGNYPQYKDEFQEPRGGYNDPMGPGMRNQGATGAGMRAGMGGMNRGGQMGNRYPVEDEGYYDEEYNEMEMMGPMGGPMGGQQRGMGYDQGYDDYTNPASQGYGGRNQGNARNDYNQYEGIAPQPQAVPQQPIGMGSLVQEPFTVEGSINSQTFDRKPGFDRNRKKVHTRERLRASLQKNKQTDQKSLKNKTDSKNQGMDDGERMHDKQPGSPDGKDHKRDQMDSDNEEGENNSRGYLEEEISSESNQKDNSQGSLEDHGNLMNSEDGMRDQ